MGLGGAHVIEAALAAATLKELGTGVLPPEQRVRVW